MLGIRRIKTITHTTYVGALTRGEVEDGKPWEGPARCGVVLGRQREAGFVAATEAQGDQGRQTSADVMSAGSVSAPRHRATQGDGLCLRAA
jgi:hypothetical protein